ncbi:MAG: PTS sugar transporter subunit IIC, partial [Clostridia bacterium]|nr:PTS sugar transporter subunit IIC [Clostridia bacterium]
KKPAIWVAPTLAGGIVGIISALLGMENVAAGAGMGTSGLVGQVTTYITMAPNVGGAVTIIYIAILHFLLPAVLSLAIDNVMRRAGFVKGSDMKLQDIK